MVKGLISEQVGSIGSWLSPVPLRGSHIAFGLKLPGLGRFRPGCFLNHKSDRSSCETEGISFIADVLSILREAWYSSLG